MSRKKRNSLNCILLLILLLLFSRPASAANVIKHRSEIKLTIASGSVYSGCGKDCLLGVYYMDEGCTFLGLKPENAAASQPNGLTVIGEYDTATAAVYYHLYGKAGDAAELRFVRQVSYQYKTEGMYEDEFTFVITILPSDDNSDTAVDEKEGGKTDNPADNDKTQDNSIGNSSNSELSVRLCCDSDIIAEQGTACKLAVECDALGLTPDFRWLRADNPELKDAIDLSRDDKTAAGSEYTPPQIMGTYYYCCCVIDKTTGKEYLSPAIKLHYLLPAVGGTPTPPFSFCRKSRQTVLFNGSPLQITAYNIDGCNYFKLRDIALLLASASIDYAVDYDDKHSLMLLTSGIRYVPTGNELKIDDDLSFSCNVSRWRLAVNDALYCCFVYNIGGNNFFKLRDLGAVLGFAVDYDAAANAVLINAGIS